MSSQGKVFRLFTYVFFRSLPQSTIFFFNGFDIKHVSVIFFGYLWWKYNRHQQTTKLLKQFHSAMWVLAPRRQSLSLRELSNTWFMKHLHALLLIDERAAKLTHLLFVRTSSDKRRRRGVFSVVWRFSFSTACEKFLWWFFAWFTSFTIPSFSPAPLTQFLLASGP